MRVIELVRYRQPAVIAELERRGLLSSAALMQDDEPFERALSWWRRLMAHDAWRRVRGALRQVRWAG